MQMIDITPTISPSTAVFPGDTPFSREVALSFEKGDNLLLSSLRSTLHIGAHTDAPNHYHKDGVGIEACSLSRYIGPCQVIDVSNKSVVDRIYPEHIAGHEIKSPRILFKTGSFPDPNQWNSDFYSLSPELINLLAEQNVILVGIDTPSVDPETSKALETHNAIYHKKLSILEGIVLDQVSEGVYTLIALPLPLKDADASPVRAVLIDRELENLEMHFGDNT